MKAVVAAFNQEKALVGAFSVITNLRMELFEALEETQRKYKIDIYLLWCLHWWRRRQHKAQGHSNHQVTGQKLCVFVILGSELSQVRCVLDPGGKNLGKSFVCPILYRWILLTELSADDWHLISSVLAPPVLSIPNFPHLAQGDGHQGTGALQQGD